ncbi:MbcA/ParS/Xre antitoxin family protein [Sedimentitalea sp. HM32M-2]|uniref:MbcA/ParS/Xre antitoxin family protein n=1 Tax=Sedimentitalea sp. HM32M-2 TaxID=3351566 RepID=UPI00362D4045
MPRAARLPKELPHHDAAPQMVAPQDMDTARRRRLSGPGLRSFLNIADAWQLSEKERLAMLGQPSRSTYYGWVKKAQGGESLTLGIDILLRISAILGVHKALTILFQQPDQALSWLRGPHAGLPFSGQAPISLMRSGTQDGLLLVRRYLDAWRGGFASQPDPSVPIEPVDRESIVFG